MLSYRKLAMRVLGRPLHTGGGIDSPRPASQRAAAFILTAAMLTTLAAPAFAKTWDIEKGDITVKAGDAEGPNNVKQGDNDFVKDEGDTVITGDGESQEGQIWEAYMAAAHYKLDNLTVIIDNNGLQIDGTNDQVMSLGDLPAKLRAFGFDLVELPDGNDLDAVEAALSKPTMPGKPKAILAHTVKGKGVSFMENQVGWHGKAPNAEQREQALKELED